VHVHLPGSKAGQLLHARGGRIPYVDLAIGGLSRSRCPSQAGETLFKGQRRVLKSPCEACKYVVFGTLRVSKGFFTLSSKKTARRRHPSWGLGIKARWLQVFRLCGLEKRSALRRCIHASRVMRCCGTLKASRLTCAFDGLWEYGERTMVLYSLPALSIDPGAFR